jgi:hypothetical protein
MKCCRCMRILQFTNMNLINHSIDVKTNFTHLISNHFSSLNIFDIKYIIYIENKIFSLFDVIILHLLDKTYKCMCLRRKRYLIFSISLAFYMSMTNRQTNYILSHTNVEVVKLALRN